MNDAQRVRERKREKTALKSGRDRGMDRGYRRREQMWGMGGREEGAMEDEIKGKKAATGSARGTKREKEEGREGGGGR